MKVYVVKHYNWTGSGLADFSVLGVYPDREQTRQAIVEAIVRQPHTQLSDYVVEEFELETRTASVFVLMLNTPMGGLIVGTFLSIDGASGAMEKDAAARRAFHDEYDIIPVTLEP